MSSYAIGMEKFRTLRPRNFRTLARQDAAIGCAESECCIA
jgi:hypothetical protein